MIRVVLIADAGPAAGLGHLSRSSALGAALSARGAEVSAFGLELEAPAERYGVRWAPAGGFHGLAASAFVLDSYRADRDFRASLRLRAPLAAFGDGHEAPDEADLWIPSGPAYACLGPPYWNISARDPSESVRRVLVATGGGDFSEAGTRIATELREKLPNATIALVRGPFSRQEAPPGVELVSAPTTLEGEFARSDLAVCAAGQTLLEALAAGLPTVATAVADNQRGQLARLAELDAVLAVADAGEAVTVAERLSADQAMRRRLARAARNAVDGRGAHRVAEAVLDLAAGLELRPATMSDAELLLEWRNDPVTRRFSLTKHEIGEDEHRAWLDARLSDPDTRLWLAIQRSRPIGQVRLTRRGESAEIHIGLAGAERGHGYGRRIIRLAVEQGAANWPDVRTIFATIDADNEASIRAFEAIGFRPDQAAGRFVLALEAHNDSR